MAARKPIDPSAALKLVEDVSHDVVEQTIHPVFPPSSGQVSVGSDSGENGGLGEPVGASSFPIPSAAPASSLAVASIGATAIDAVAVPAPFIKKAASSAMEKTMKTAEEFVSFGQGNVEAMMKCGQIWATGMQDLSKNLAASAQAQLDQTMSTFKAMTSVKSLKEAMELHSTLARSSVEMAVAESGKLTDASMKLAEQSMAPITARVTLAVEKFGSVEKFGRTV